MRKLERYLGVCSTVVLIGAAGPSPAAASPLGQISENTQTLFSAGEKLGHFTSAPDGSLWFINDGTEGFVDGIATGPTIVKVEPSGIISPYQQGLNVPAPTGGSLPYGITSGPDGRMWFTDAGNPRAVGAVTTGGHITEYTTGLNSGADPLGIATGSDGNLWFADNGTTKAIGQSTSAGKITEYSSGLNSGAAPHEVALGPDGNVWFTDEGTMPAIGKITPAGQITEYSSGLNSGSYPVGITAGPDGSLWFADNGTTPAIGRITASGQITEYSAGLNAKSSPRLIVPGGDGNLWFTDQGATPAIGRITPGGQITEYSSGLPAGAAPAGITAGPGGDLWFTDSAHSPAIGQIGDGLPVVAFLWGQIFPTTGTVADTVNPGGLPTTYYVEYGATTAYGSATAPQSAGAGDTAVTVTATLASLVPSSTYHYRFVATNAAGTGFSDDRAFTTPPAPVIPPSLPPVFVPPAPPFFPVATTTPSSPSALLSLVHTPAVRSTSVLVALGCGGAPGERCSGAIVLDTWERFLGSEVVGPAPRSGRSHRKLVTVGLKWFSIPAGATRTVTVTLNRTGRRLLRRFGHLAAVVHVSGNGLRHASGTVVTFSATGP
jgi:streptogramin lyase